MNIEEFDKETDTEIVEIILANFEEVICVDEDINKFIPTFSLEKFEVVRGKGNMIRFKFRGNKFQYNYQDGEIGYLRRYDRWIMEDHGSVFDKMTDEVNKRLKGKLTDDAFFASARNREKLLYENLHISNKNTDLDYVRNGKPDSDVHLKAAKTNYDNAINEKRELLNENEKRELLNNNEIGLFVFVSAIFIPLSVILLIIVGLGMFEDAGGFISISEWFISNTNKTEY